MRTEPPTRSLDTQAPLAAPVGTNMRYCNEHPAPQPRWRRAALAARGGRPALRPSESLVRVGAGSDADVRPRPMPAAMMRVAPSLRLELAQAADIPPSGSDTFTERQRVRMHALAAVLRCQPERAPRRLSHEIAILVAVLDGRLDSLCDATPAAAAQCLEQLIEYLRCECYGVLDAIDQTGEMDDAVEATLEGRDPRLVARCDVDGILTALDLYGIYDVEDLEVHRLDLDVLEVRRSSSCQSHRKRTNTKY